MEDRDKMIIAIIFSIIGFVSLIFIIIFIIFFIIRCKTNQSLKKPLSSTVPHRSRYLRSQKLSTNKSYNSNRKNRFDTINSAISLTFEPPHLINQNVRNLDKLFQREMYTSNNFTRNENIIVRKTFDGCYINPISRDISDTPSPVPTELPNYAVALQSSNPSNNKQSHILKYQFLNELNQILCSRQEQRSIPPIKYSQSCRKPTDQLPFDYYRPLTPLSTNQTISSSDTSHGQNQFQILRCPNSTLLRKARLGQLRDDTAILY